MVFSVGRSRPPVNPPPGFVAATQLTASVARHPVLKSPLLAIRVSGHDPNATAIPLDLVRASWRNANSPNDTSNPKAVSSDGHTRILAMGSVPSVAEKHGVSGGPGRRVRPADAHYQRPYSVPSAPPLRSSTGATIHRGTRRGGALLAWSIAVFLVGLILIGCGFGINHIINK